MICNMEKEKKAGKTDRFSKVITMKVKSMVEATTAGTMEVNTMETGTKTKLMVSESTVG